jgi:hypothetical protein
LRSHAWLALLIAFVQDDLEIPEGKSLPHGIKHRAFAHKLQS